MLNLLKLFIMLSLPACSSTAEKLPTPSYLARGLATWYDLAAHGSKTSSGEIYDLSLMTAAHASLPLFTQVNVTNLHTQESLTVTINDRLSEPKVLIKLSYQAAQQLGLLKEPSPLVEVRSLPSQPLR